MAGNGVACCLGEPPGAARGRGRLFALIVQDEAVPRVFVRDAGVWKASCWIWLLLLAGSSESLEQIRAPSNFGITKVDERKNLHSNTGHSTQCSRNPSVCHWTKCIMIVSPHQPSSQTLARTFAKALS